MRNFHVFVTGIAGFVEDFRRVVAVSAPQPRRMRIVESGVRRDVLIPPHFPYLRIPLDHADADTQARMRILQDWNVSAATGAFPPFNENPIRQTLVKFLHSQEVILPDSETPAALNANDILQDDRSALWLPTLSTLGAQAATIDPKHITKDPDPNVVSAYLRFPKGLIETAKVSEFKFGSISLDGHAAGTLNRALPVLMVCTMSIPNDAFTVVCRSYQGEADFEIGFLADKDDPWMVFVCSSLEDALQLPSTEPKFGTDFHFGLAYDLVQGPITEEDVALPKSSALAPDVKPLGAGKCIPPRFLGGSTGGM